MSKKTLMLITGIVGGVSTIASAVVAFCGPAYEPAIIGAIEIGATAIIEACTLFVSSDK